MIDPALLAEQVLNGVQLGVMLFLMSAGLTIMFGIMNFINMTHGAAYMMGAYFATTFLAWTHSFVLAIILALAAAGLLGVALDLLATRHLYDRSHLDQVLGTIGLLMFFNELVLVVWGPDPRFMAIPGFLNGAIMLPGGLAYPVYRLAITGAGLATAGLIYALLAHTRLGMLIRAGATGREMLAGLGVNVSWLFTLVFALAVTLAAFAGMMTAPLIAVQSGMGDTMLIVAFVVIVIGGVGAIGGALASAILVGLVDTLGRALLPALLGYTAGPALASMSIYVLMAVVLLIRPQGLFAIGRG